jgi:hypothetical protein
MPRTQRSAQPFARRCAAEPGPYKRSVLVTFPDPSGTACCTASGKRELPRRTRARRATNRPPNFAEPVPPPLPAIPPGCYVAPAIKNKN